MEVDAWAQQIDIRHSEVADARTRQAQCGKQSAILMFSRPITVFAHRLGIVFMSVCVCVCVAALFFIADAVVFLMHGLVLDWYIDFLSELNRQVSLFCVCLMLCL